MFAIRSRLHAAVKSTDHSRSIMGLAATLLFWLSGSGLNIVVMNRITCLTLASVILAACSGQDSATFCADLARDVELTRQDVADLRAEIASLERLSYGGLTGMCDDECGRDSSACVGQPDFSRCMIAAEDRSHARFDRSMIELIGDQWRRPDFESDVERSEWEQSRSDAFREHRQKRNSALAEALQHHADALGRSVDAITEGRCAA